MLIRKVVKSIFYKLTGNVNGNHFVKIIYTKSIVKHKTIVIIFLTVNVSEVDLTTFYINISFYLSMFYF